MALGPGYRFAIPGWREKSGHPQRCSD